MDNVRFIVRSLIGKNATMGTKESFYIIDYYPIISCVALFRLIFAYKFKNRRKLLLAQPYHPSIIISFSYSV